MVLIHSTKKSIDHWIDAQHNIPLRGCTSEGQDQFHRRCPASVRPSVPSFDRTTLLRRVCCWAPRTQEISIDSGGSRAPRSSGAAAARGRGTALSSERGQCRVDGWRRKLNWQTGKCLYVCRYAYVDESAADAVTPGAATATPGGHRAAARGTRLWRHQVRRPLSTQGA